MNFYENFNLLKISPNKIIIILRMQKLYEHMMHARSRKLFENFQVKQQLIIYQNISF